MRNVLAISLVCSATFASASAAWAAPACAINEDEVALLMQAGNRTQVVAAVSCKGRAYVAEWDNRETQGLEWLFFGDGRIGVAHVYFSPDEPDWVYGVGNSAQSTPFLVPTDTINGQSGAFEIPIEMTQ